MLSVIGDDMFHVEHPWLASIARMSSVTSPGFHVEHPDSRSGIVEEPVAWNRLVAGHLKGLTHGSRQEAGGPKAWSWPWFAHWKPRRDQSASGGSRGCAAQSIAGLAGRFQA